MIMRCRPCLIVSLVSLAVVAVSFQNLRVTVNGKPDSAAIVRNGKVFVSEDALKAAGASVARSASGVSITFTPAAGRNQVEAAEGKLGDWLSNGTWRVRVTKVEPAPNPFGKGPGFRATIEIRNLGTRAQSPFGTGMDKLQIIDSKGNTLAFQQASLKDFFKDIAPANGFTNEVLFGDPTNALAEVGEPDKLLILFRATGGKTLVNFRVDLRE